MSATGGGPAEVSAERDDTAGPVPTAGQPDAASAQGDPAVSEPDASTVERDPAVENADLVVRQNDPAAPEHDLVDAEPDPGAAPGDPTGRPRVVFVLGGGGIHGAAEVGMLRALVERDIRPDLVLGTSVGALNGALYAADPSTAVERLIDLWDNVDANSPFEASLLERASTFARTRTHLHGNHRLRRLLLQHLPVRRFEELEIPFACVAASIERAGARWFDRGDLIEALLATSAVPGLLPPVEIAGEHFLDGGLVDSIPVGRAIELGGSCVFVLQVGRIEQPLTAPSKPWEVGVIAFEIARRHRFVEAMARVPEEVDVHVLPTGDAMSPTDPAQFRYRDASRVADRIATAYRSAAAYLDGLPRGHGQGCAGGQG